MGRMIGMLDAKFIRNNAVAIREMLEQRGDEAPLDRFLELDQQRRTLVTEVEQLKARRNEVSDKIAVLKREKKEADDLIAEMRRVSQTVKEYDETLRGLEDELLDCQMRIPNMPHRSVHIGVGEEDNKEIRRVGEVPNFSSEPAAHWDIGTKLSILDLERGGKVTGSRFYFLMGAGARLERALISFMLDMHIERHGYTEVFPPFIANRDSAAGTGQLPKFGEDMFRLEGLDYYLIPTAEVPVTNLYRDEILAGERLPLKYAAYSACFRSEAGAHGRDTRGVIRVHQFNKVELVKFALPETSYDELEALTQDAEAVLQKLGLAYRVTRICTADLGFTAAKKYDIEVWMPSYGRFVEISSCSNFEDFQARRANIRFRRERGSKPEFVHTLNGSGVAVGRCLAAVLENYQRSDGSVAVPKVLQPYMGGMEVIQ